MAAALIVVVSLLLSTAAAAQGVRVGEPAPEWQVSDWANSPPLSLEDLRGKVVLVRWWTAPDCPYCRTSSVQLNAWQKKYSARGFSVVGIYHHKAGSPLSVGDVKRYATDLGFAFPVAVDRDWATLKSWWLDHRPDADWTSASFLIDRRGVVRQIHPGGEYHADEAQELESRIESLLAEPAAAAQHMKIALAYSSTNPGRW